MRPFLAWRPQPHPDFLCNLFTILHFDDLSVHCLARIWAWRSLNPEGLHCKQENAWPQLLRHLLPGPPVS